MLQNYFQHHHSLWGNLGTPPAILANFRHIWVRMTTQICREKSQFLLLWMPISLTQTKMMHWLFLETILLKNHQFNWLNATRKIQKLFQSILSTLKCLIFYPKLFPIHLTHLVPYSLPLQSYSNSSKPGHICPHLLKISIFMLLLFFNVSVCTKKNPDTSIHQEILLIKEPYKFDLHHFHFHLK